MLEPLLVHGPAAVSRVAAQLHVLTDAVDAEHAAFIAFRTASLAAGAQPRRPMDEGHLVRAGVYVHPAVSEALEDPDGVVVDLDAHRGLPIER